MTGPGRELAELPEYLSSPPECLQEAGLPTVGFHYHSTHEVPGHAFQINVVRTIQPPTPQATEGLGLIVDIDVGTEQPLPCADAVLEDHLQAMHWLKNKVFFNLMTNQAICRFQKGQS